MNKLNYMVYLQAFADQSPNNNPSLGNFKWTREVSGALVSNPVSNSFTLAPNESRTLFSGSRSLLADGSTQYSIAPVPLTPNVYQITNTSGTSPAFRTLRSIGADATTQVTVTTNGPIATFASTAGTAFNLASVLVGDIVMIGSNFNPQNQAQYKVIAKTSTSFTVENQTAVNETVTLGSGFANQVRIFSASGVQAGDTLVISSGFSPVTYGSYEVMTVTDYYVQFYSADVLPTEMNVVSLDLAIYSQAKSLVYLEVDQKCGVSLNGSGLVYASPFVTSSLTSPGVLMLNSTIWSLTITNTTTNVANCFIATVE